MPQSVGASYPWVLPALGHDWSNNDGVCKRDSSHTCDHGSPNTAVYPTCETCGAEIDWREGSVIVLSLSGISLTYGQSLTVSGAVTLEEMPSLTIHPTTAGTVTLTVTDADNNRTTHTLALAAADDPIYSTTLNLNAGTYTIRAAYSGDDTYKPSVSTDQSVTVNKAGVTITTSDVPDRVPFGVDVTVQALFTGIAGTIPTGRAEFRLDNGQRVTVPLRNGRAAQTFSDLSLGSHTIKVSYSGDANHQYKGAQGAITFTVIAACDYYGNHEWNAPQYTWTGDLSACTAIRTCSRDANHTETAQGTVSIGTVTLPTCEANGIQPYTATFTEEWAQTQTNTKTLAALGHSYEGQTYASDNNATCTEDGTKTARCVRYGQGGCSATDTMTDAGSRLGHTFESYTSDNNAACEADGTKTARCVRYGQNGCTATDTMIYLNSRRGHIPVINPAVPATRTSTGLTAGSHCGVCGIVLEARRVTAKLSNNPKQPHSEPHRYTEWTLYDEFTHAANCRLDGCGRLTEVDCTRLNWLLPMIEGEEPDEIMLCPVCGQVVERARLPLVEDARAEALTSDTELPDGNLIVHLGELDTGEKLLSVVFEKDGKPVQPEGEIKITLPADLLEDYTLRLLAPDGTEADLPFEIDGDTVSFTLDFTPKPDEQPVPARLIRLIPNEG